MATKYAGKYRRSPYPQTARIKKHIISNGTYYWVGRFGIPTRTSFLSLLGGTNIFTGGDMSSSSPPPPLLCTLNTAKIQLTILGRTFGSHLVPDVRNEPKRRPKYF